jgi:hypothetical protein
VIQVLPEPLSWWTDCFCVRSKALAHPARIQASEILTETGRRAATGCLRHLPTVCGGGQGTRRAEGMRGRRHWAADVATGSETQGIDNFAIADVAAGAGVQETSIFYRRWGSRRENPVVAALLGDRTTTTAIIDTGCARTAFSVIERGFRVAWR